jgi:hypothetical protein
MDIENKPVTDESPLHTSIPTTESSTTLFQPIETAIHKEMTHIIWGNNLKEDVFERWSQGMESVPNFCLKIIQKLYF